jgi:hypothetical protein
VTFSLFSKILNGSTKEKRSAAAVAVAAFRVFGKGHCREKIEVKALKSLRRNDMFRDPNEINGLAFRSRSILFRKRFAKAVSETLYFAAKHFLSLRSDFVSHIGQWIWRKAASRSA